jgi:hypothetical protein
MRTLGGDGCGHPTRDDLPLLSQAQHLDRVGISVSGSPSDPEANTGPQGPSEMGEIPFFDAVSFGQP